jgi:hypothetical protein
MLVHENKYGTIVNSNQREADEYKKQAESVTDPVEKQRLLTKAEELLKSGSMSTIPGVEFEDYKKS